MEINIELKIEYIYYTSFIFVQFTVPGGHSNMQVYTCLNKKNKIKGVFFSKEHIKQVMH